MVNDDSDETMNLASSGRLTWRHGVDASEEKLPSTQDRGGDGLLAAQVLLKGLERKKQKHQNRFRVLMLK